MVTTKLNLSMTEPSVRQIYAKQGDTGRVLDITLDQTPEDGTLRILRPDGVEVTSEANLASDTYNVQTTPYYSGETTDLGMVMGTIEGKSEQDALPSGYQAIEYIQSTGHEYINTGFVPTSDDGFEVDFITNNGFDSSGNYGCILGARTSSNTLDFQLTTWTSYAGGGERGAVRWGTGLAHDAGLLDNGARQKAKLYQKTYTAPNGITWSFTPNYTGAYPIYVFSLNQSGSPTQNGSVILYSLKFYRGADLAMHLIPCKRTSDNKLGLYDVVGGTFLPVANMDSSANPQGGGNVTLPNPTNPLPITSFSPTEFVSEGKNLYNSAGLNRYGQHGITVTQSSDGTLVFNGTATNIAYFTFTNTGYANKQYTFSLNNPVTNSGVHIAFRDTNGNYFGDVPANTVNEVVTFTNEPNNIYLYVLNGTTLSNFVVKPQLELGYTATAFVPYQSPSTASVSLTLRSLPDGTCDTYEDGVVTRRVGAVDLGTLTWGYEPNNNRFTSRGIANLIRDDGSRTTAMLCTAFKVLQNGEAFDINLDGVIYKGGADNAILVQDHRYTVTSEFQTAMDGVELLYPLATPTTETVTIPTLVTYENYTYVHNDSEVDPASIEYKAIMLEPGQVAIPSEATEIVGKCYCDVEQNGVSSMPFTLNVKKNERQ